MATKAAAKSASRSKSRSTSARSGSGSGAGTGTKSRPTAVRKSVGGAKSTRRATSGSKARSTGKSRTSASSPSLLSTAGISRLGTKTVKAAKDLVAKGAELIEDIMPGHDSKTSKRRSGGSKKSR